MTPRVLTVDFVAEVRVFVTGDAADLLDLAGAALDRVRAEGFATLDEVHAYPGSDGRVVLVLGPAAEAEAFVLAWAAGREGLAVVRECAPCERARGGACRLHRAAMTTTEEGRAD